MMVSDVHEENSPRLPSRAPTSRQIRSIRVAMGVFVEEDIERGLSAGVGRGCAACRELRPRAGFIAYGGHDLCNHCATIYEIARVSGLVATIEPFVREPQIRSRAVAVIAADDHSVSAA